MAIVQTWNFNEEISEANLLGMICFMYDTFDLRPVLDIEISLTRRPTYFPEELGKSFTLVANLDIIKGVHSKLRTVDSKLTKLEIQAIYGKDNPNTESNKTLTYFFVKKEDSDDFIAGYLRMSGLVKGLLLREQEEQEEQVGEYKDEWKLDPEFIKTAKLIAKPGENVTEKNFLLGVPSYCWEIPSRQTYMEQTAVDLLSLYLKNCTDEEHMMLIEKPTYLRFLLYQDTADGNPYVYGYIREIDDCTYPSQRQVLTLARTRGDLLPCEISFAKRGFFYDFSVTEWKNKVIEHIGSFA
jgi:hypothetical protein